MNWICFIKKENVKKAESALKSDFDLAAKQSITVRNAKALNVEKDGSFFLISGSEEGVKKCKELIKEFVEEAKEKELEKAKEKIDKEGEAAAEGMGGIFG